MTRKIGIVVGGVLVLLAMSFLWMLVANLLFWPRLSSPSLLSPAVGDVR